MRVSRIITTSAVIMLFSTSLFARNAARSGDLTFFGGKPESVKGVVTSVSFAKTKGKASVIFMINGNEKITALYSALPQSIQASSQENITSRLLDHFVIVAGRRPGLKIGRGITVRKPEELMIEKHAQEDKSFMEPV